MNNKEFECSLGRLLSQNAALRDNVIIEKLSPLFKTKNNKVVMTSRLRGRLKENEEAKEEGKQEVLKRLAELKKEVIPRIINADWIKTKFDVGLCYERGIINELFREFNYSECESWGCEDEN